MNDTIKTRYYNSDSTDKIITLVPTKMVKLKKAIKDLACNCFYRQNSAGSDCYAFSYDVIGKKYLDGTTCKKIDYSGGWDWSNAIVDTGATYLYMIATDRFYKIIT
jgi:hypothetical protein